MMFALTTLNRDGHIQEFSFQVDTLEAGLDFISGLAARKETILSVYVVDKKSLTPLPLEAFDGSLLSTGIGQLQAQWKQILTKPRSKPTDPWIQARIDQNVFQHESMIKSVRQLIGQLAHLRIPDAYKQDLTQRYQAILATYERQLIRTHAMRKRLSRLGQVTSR